MYELIALALQTDSTRIATLEIGGDFMPQNLGIKKDYHALSHHGNDPEAIASLIALESYQIMHFGKFLTRLAGMNDGNRAGVVSPACRGRRFDRLEQQIFRNRLHQEGDCAGIRATVLHAGLIVSGQHDCRNARTDRLKMLLKLESGRFLHLQIDDQAGGHFGLQGLQELTHQSKCLHTVRKDTDKAGQRLSYRGIIIDDGDIGLQLRHEAAAS